MVTNDTDSHSYLGGLLFPSLLWSIELLCLPLEVLETFLLAGSPLGGSGGSEDMGLLLLLLPLWRLRKDLRLFCCGWMARKKGE